MKIKLLIGITTIGLIIGAIAYWFQPYNQSTVLGIHMWLIMSLGAFLGSLLPMVFLKEKPFKIAMLVSFGVLLAVLFRIIYDTAFWDSTSHNLAPFEIIIAGIVTFPSAIAGVYLGFLIKKYLK